MPHHHHHLSFCQLCVILKYTLCSELSSDLAWWEEKKLRNRDPLELRIGSCPDVGTFECKRTSRLLSSHLQMTESVFSFAAGNTHFKSPSPDLTSPILETSGVRTKLRLWLSSYSWFYLLCTSTLHRRSKTSICKFEHFLKARIIR